MATASSLALLPSTTFGGLSEPSRPKFLDFRSKPTNLILSVSSHSRFCKGKTLRVSASVSVPNLEVQTGPGDLVDSILSKVTQSDRGVLLKKEEHEKVAEVAQELQKYCVNEPVKCPLIFGDWDVVYCSVPTSPGGGYRSALGRLVLTTKEMIQGIEAPDIVKNKVIFSAFGFLDGEVSLKGKLTALDDEWVQVIFEPPELKVGGLEFRYGGVSEVKLRITYIDDKIRLGKGSKGSLFVFQRRNSCV
ncbi:Plastid lipid-associated protein/fibrillin conserved domain containing protein [Trema orientale]|uniref:Plastid lipid-associated protein/fibrillin conserved domain containing protein n=1 Tax=Trema orientale TaxID=63057 RepID=A0A2P5G198_TREOI|nr:Plastid lipid-associated protein/fibrillin conserved domain containing protein [Trema orientale]